MLWSLIVMVKVKIKGGHAVRPESWSVWLITWLSRGCCSWPLCRSFTIDECIVLAIETYRELSLVIVRSVGLERVLLVVVGADGSSNKGRCDLLSINCTVFFQRSNKLSSGVELSLHPQLKKVACGCWAEWHATRDKKKAGDKEISLLRLKVQGLREEESGETTSWRRTSCTRIFFFSQVTNFAAARESPRRWKGKETELRCQSIPFLFFLFFF